MPRRYFQSIVIFLLTILILLLSPVHFFTEDFITGLQREIVPVPEHLIPHKIWQVKESGNTTTKSGIPSTAHPAILSWILHNPDYEYTLLSDAGGKRLLPLFPKHRGPLAAIFASARLAHLRAQLLPYMALSAVGGVYASLDTTALVSADTWIPDEHRTKIKAIIGVTYDQRGDERLRDGCAHPVQFGTWTVAAARGHTVGRGMVEQVLAGVAKLAEKQRVAVGNVKLSDDDVRKLTDSAAFSSAAFQSIQANSAEVITFADLSYLSAPKLFGDILVLPVNRFGMGQSHSGSSSNEKEAFVRHNFRMKEIENRDLPTYPEQKTNIVFEIRSRGAPASIPALAVQQVA